MQREEIGNENNAKEETNFRVYELGYLLVPTIPEADVPVQYGNLKELVASLKGVVISDEMPKMISLAYLMVKTVANARHKFKTAYFGWIKFTMATDAVLELKRSLTLIRTLLDF